MAWGSRKEEGMVTLPPLESLPDTPPPPIAANRGVGPARVSAFVDARDADLLADETWKRIAAAADDALPVAGGYRRAHYDRFRRENTVRPPPGAVPDGSAVTVMVDGSRAAPFLLRETLRSLQDQSVSGWRAIVLTPPSIPEHPVGSFADVDARIGFAPVDAAVESGGWLLLLTAGTRLDPEALAWLLFAARRTGATAVFADHDHGIVVPGRGPVRADPWLYWARDAAALDQLPAPALVLARAEAALPLRGEAATGDDGWRRRVLQAATGAVPHVPRLLSTMIELPLQARGAPPGKGDAQPGALGPIRHAAAPRYAAAHDGRIAVIMPTRDGGEMLVRAVQSLHATARAPDRLDVIVADNRSVKPETAAAIDGLEARGLARRVAFDQPFNWALINNLAVAQCDAPFLLFANDDLEVIRRDWDDALIAALSDDRVGAVGARLLYENRTVQHGGMVFGMGEGHPEHEGREVLAADEGPGRRLAIARDAASVTGALLGCRRAMFDAVGGFDAATMFVGHSDVDFCMKVREAGSVVRYEPLIEAIHYESITRGRNVTKTQVAWDEGERMELVDRWGESLIVDPGVNPYWAPGCVPFLAYREPTMREIVAHIDRTGRADPWYPTRLAQQEIDAWSPAAVAGRTG